MRGIFLKLQSTLLSEPSMTLSKINNSSEISLREANCLALEEGAEFLLTLPSKCYSEHFKPAFQSTIGAHFRHILEHYQCFFGQLESTRFNYDERPRDSELEQDSEYAKSTISLILLQLRALDITELKSNYVVLDHYSEQPIPTSLARELAFLHAHTVHHFALIAALARGLGVETPVNFGVAIATLSHQFETKK